MHTVTKYIPVSSWHQWPAWCSEGAIRGFGPAGWPAPVSHSGCSCWPERKNIRQSSLSLHIHQILITGMDESSCEQIIMQNIAPVDAILGIQFRICQTSLSPHFTDAVLSKRSVCIWHNKTFCSDNTFSDSTLIHSQHAFLVMKQPLQQMEIEGKIADWNEQTENKSMPKLWASSGYDGSLAEFSTTILNLPACILLLDTLSLPSHSHCFSFAHLLANESFHVQLKCHSWQAKARHQENNEPPDLCFYDQQKKERTKHPIITDFQHLWRLLSFLIIRIDTSRRGRE